MGRIGDINADANVKLKKLYGEAGIEECEIKMPGVCWRNNALGFAHKHKRIWYRACPELLSSMEHTVLACTPCHQEIEHDEKLTLQIFKRLRPKSTTMPAKQKPISKREEKRNKKADWIRPHKCKGCGKIVTGTWHPECGSVTI